MRLTIITICVLALCWYFFIKIQPHEITNPEEPKGLNNLPLTQNFGLTYMNEGSFECPAYRTFEKIGLKVHIMAPDTIKKNPLILSDWKVRIDSGSIRKKFRGGDFDKLPHEIQKLFWFEGKN